MDELRINQLFQKFENGELNDTELVCFVEIIKSAQKNSNTNNVQSCVKSLVNIINFFQSKENVIKLKKAQSIIFKGPEALRIFDKHQFDRIYYMPSRTKEQRDKKRELKAELKMLYRSSRLIKKHFPSGIKEPDESELINSLNLSETGSAEKKAKKQAIKSAQRNKKKFENAVRPYIEAKKLVSEYNKFKSFEELEVRYNLLCSKAEA